MSTAAELHQAMFAAIQARDFDALRRLFGPQSVHVSGDGVEKVGPEPLIAEVSKFTTAFPDLTITIGRQHASGETVSIIEYTFSGTHLGELQGFQPTGERISVVACSVLEAAGGTIRREADYFDTMALMAQLGQRAEIA
jgi:steroid delta-isomerase-like uncharacterized protein